MDRSYSKEYSDHSTKSPWLHVVSTTMSLWDRSVVGRMVKQGPCVDCGSSDARTWYDDGSEYCFSCQTYKPARGFVSSVVNKQQFSEFPSDLTPELTPECLTMLRNYGILEFKSRFMYSPLHNRLYFTHFDDGKLTFCAGRTLGNNAIKWLSYGTKPYEVVGDKEHDTVFVVEDAFSGLRLAKLVPTIILYGKSLPTAHLRALGRKFKTIAIWLDWDAFSDASKIGQVAHMMGMKVRVIRTLSDPKDIGPLETYI